MVDWIQNTMDSWEKFGFLTDAVGDRFWGTNIKDPKLRYTHSVFSPIDRGSFPPVVIHGDKIDDHPYAHILDSMNGVNLFHGDFVLYGLHLSSEPVTKIFMPFSLVDHNIDYRSLCIRHEALLVGGYNIENKEFHILQRKCGSVVKVEKSTLKAEIINPTLEQFLEERLLRVASSEKWVRIYKELSAAG
ncbi:hypothetical protein SAMN04488030_0173 [Aliiroseovarius halocynthiae]|uniref:Uncharacterized protein n=1 Tax=Aliiroseovarius halocynthiae TaxID=985055 RepID=A0A545SKR4_9RHOB|nr:hypothetical protein [Aliiroseovarius halocynthiae]TQV65568.1 hypothetical protein FIL88_16625 [Aliiroseovarius halocynthiae]SMR84087.1 hypothetical protein SAMN04488030_0173 [Aliiroseovarius halocynthiae]